MDRIRLGKVSPDGWFGKALSHLERPFMRATAELAAGSASARDDPFSDRLQVLVVDDLELHRQAASDFLSRWGITPRLAADGAQAVALACAHCYDLILMDLQMPVLDGLAATSQIRRFELEHSRARVPVVAYTSCAFSGNERMLQDCGVDAVLDKPCDADSLRECLRRWCRSGAIPRRSA